MCLGGLACCASQLLCGSCLSCGKGKSKDDDDEEYGNVSSVVSRLLYGLILGAGFLICILFMTNPWDMTDKIASGCKSEIPADLPELRGLCSVDVMIYRVSLSLVIFFSIHLLLSPGVWVCGVLGSALHTYQSNFFCWKFLGWLVLLAACMFIPSQGGGFLMGYSWFAMILGALFILLQIVILLDFAFEWNERWCAKEGQIWPYLLIGCTVVLYLIGLGFIVTEFVVFTKDDHTSCALEKTIISLTLIFGVAYTLLSMVLKHDHASVLPSGVVFCYTAYTCYNALSSGSSAECNRWYVAATDSNGSITVQIVISTIFAGLSLLWASMSASGRKQVLAFSKDDDEEEDDEDAGKVWTFFHFVMLLASGFMAMMLSGWRPGNPETPDKVDSGSAAMWAKIIAMWLTTAAYVWALVAPAIFRDRDFGVKFYDEV